jgi:hypothetical protein
MLGPHKSGRDHMFVPILFPSGRVSREECEAKKFNREMFKKKFKMISSTRSGKIKAVIYSSIDLKYLKLECRSGVIPKKEVIFHIRCCL